MANTEEESPGQAPATVTLWGCRGSVPTPGPLVERHGGNTACVSLQAGEHVIIFDAGTGIRTLGTRLTEQLLTPPDTAVPEDVVSSPPPVFHLFLSHTHWDHIQGLPFFGPAYADNVTIVIYGSPKKEKQLHDILHGQMSTDYFPLDMTALAAHIEIRELTEEALTIGPVTVDWQEQHYHPGGCVRYRATVGDATFVYATDVELDRMFNPTSPTKQHLTQAREYLEFVEGASLLIGDGQYTANEYVSKVGWGHTAVPTLLDCAYQAQVKRTAVFHHDPLHTDLFLDELADTYAEKYAAKSPSMSVFWAREELTVPL